MGMDTHTEYRALLRRYELLDDRMKRVLKLVDAMEEVRVTPGEFQECKEKDVSRWAKLFRDSLAFEVTPKAP